MATIEQNTELEEEIDILAYIKLFLSKWYWIALSCIICGIIALGVYRYATKVFEANASIIIVEKEDALGCMSSLLKDFGQMGTGKANIDNQIGVLQSYTLINKTLHNIDYRISYFNHGRVHNVEIYKDSPFYVDLDTSYYDYDNKQLYTPEPIEIKIISDDEYRLTIDRDSCTISKLMVWGEQYQDSIYKFTIRKSDKFDIKELKDQRMEYVFVINNYNTLTKLYQKQLVVEASSKKGTIVNLSIKDNVPEKATDFLNGLIEACIEKDLEEKNKTSQKSEEFINSQLTQITDSLMFAETNLEEFRSNNKIVNLSDEGSLLYKKLEEQEKNKSTLDIRLKYYNYLLRSIQIKEQDIKMPSITGIDDPLLNSLISQLNKLYTEKQVLAFSATPDNPSLQIINMKIEQTVGSLVDNVNSLIESTKLELSEIQKEIEKTDANIQQLPSTERELINIQRKFDVNNTVYSFLLQKRAEIGLTKAANISDIKILDEARPENALQSFPKTKFLFLIALFLGICIPCAIILLINQLDKTIKNKSEIETKTSVPIIGTILHNRHSDQIPVKTKPKSSIAESFRAIRSNLPFFLKSSGSTSVIALTSTVSGEGKSFCALNLASILSLVNKKVLLIGLDLRKPRVAEMLNVSNNIGVTTHLIGRDSLDDVILHSEINNLDVIVAGPIPPNPAELIESPEFDAFITNCKGRGYDYIILDTPPIGLVADTIAIAKHADANIFVMRQNYTSKESISLANSLAKEHQIENLSIMLNDVDINGQGYGYGYGYGYGTYRDKNSKHGYYSDEEEEKTSFFSKFKRKK
ncbi:MAG: polysaccharide biosynthesis tyrosine autokinase [Bacteroidales bacterium]|nr:polysaccharide biosynthesis tyrosine autokinase [Bacteroidales bacterium]